ncbi:molybdopterin molybdotransferase MoeA [Paenibacillus athensensis]|nr:molybdopterin molybdotransferase MoeA [Paenibacillus athensensis]
MPLRDSSSGLALRFGRQALGVAAARELLLSYARCMTAETLPLALALGRRLAAPLDAACDVPHFRRSGVDGYAVRAADIAGATPERPARLRVGEVIAAGDVPRRRLTPGAAARIMTGAAVPEGADTVVMLEMTDAPERAAVGVVVGIRKMLPAGSNLTPVAGEMAAGERLLDAGARIGPGEAALLAAFGHHEARVLRKPRVAIFATGAELLNVDEPLRPGRIRNSNSYMLAAQVLEAGGEPVIMPALSDDAAQVERAILRAVGDADLVLTTGGVSVGDRDVLVELFARWSGRLLFNKVALRPGSPTSAAELNGKLLLALSGNPGAAFVGFELFAAPVLRAMLGNKAPVPRPFTALLDADYPKGSAYPRYVRGMIGEENGCLRVRPAGMDKSSLMVTIKDADCLIVLPAGGSGFTRGQRVQAYPLRMP